MADRRVCVKIARLDGQSYQPAVVLAIHQAGADDGDHVGTIASSADGRTTPGVLSIASTDADFIEERCGELGIDPKHIDS